MKIALSTLALAAATVLATPAQAADYRLDYQGVRFIIVSSDQMLRDEAIARSQTEWVESLLKNNPCKWTVMAFHHPFFSTSATVILSAAPGTTMMALLPVPSSRKM